MPPGSPGQSNGFLAGNSPGINTASGQKLIIVCSSVAAVSIISTCLRIAAQRIKKLSLGAHDYCMLVATALMTVSTVLAITGGTFTEDVKYEVQAGMTLSCLYGITLAFVKTSLIVLYYKLFASKPSIRIAIFATGIIIWAWAIGNFAAVFLICFPFAYNWDRSIPGGHCANLNAMVLTGSVFNIGTHLMVLALPIPYLWKLQIKIGRKIGLLAAFSLGIIACAISGYRLDQSTIPHPKESPLMWTALELQVAVVAANIPLCRPIAVLVLPSTWLRSAQTEPYEMEPQHNLSRHTKEFNIRARVRDSIMDDSILSWSPRENISSMRLTRPTDGNGTTWASDDENSSGRHSSLDRNCPPEHSPTLTECPTTPFPPAAYIRDSQSFRSSGGESKVMDKQVFG